MNLRHLLFVALAAVLVTGCVKTAQNEAAQSALNSATAQQETDTSGSAQTGLPSTLPSELVLGQATVQSSTEVADGYQVGFSVSQPLQSIKDYYQQLDGWTQVAEFTTGETQSVSIERADQRVLITITPKGSGRSEVLVTGSFVKE